MRGEIGEEVASRSAEAHFHPTNSTKDTPISDTNSELECDNHSDEEDDVFFWREK